MTITDLGVKTSGTETAELFPKSSVARAFSQRRALRHYGYGLGTRKMCSPTRGRRRQYGGQHRHPNQFRANQSRHTSPIGPIDPGGVLLHGL